MMQVLKLVNIRCVSQHKQPQPQTGSVVSKHSIVYMHFLFNF